MDSGDWSDIILATLVSVFFAAGLIWVALNYSDSIGTPSLVLTGLSGAAIGWVAGILVSPYDPKEQSAFGDYAKVIYGFLSGYALSKLDPIISDAIKTAGEKQIVICSFALVSFLTAAALTYITRRYWTRST